MDKPFICIGDVSQDNFFFINDASVHCDLNDKNCTLELKYGQKIPVENYKACLGGNGANVAVGLHRLGIPTELLTVFGSDDRGLWLKKCLLTEGIGLENSQTDPKRESNISSIIVFKNERTILTFHGQEENLKQVPVCDWIYLTNISANSFKPEQKRTAKLVFNPSAKDLQKGKDFLQPILNVVDILIVNKEEFEILEKFKSKITVVTNGPNGADVFENDKSWHLNALPAKVIETTGAGDAFSSGFLAGLYFGKNIEEAMKWGMANSASVISQIGAQTGLLTQEQITKLT